MNPRTVLCSDAVLWLESQEILKGCSLVASLPDISEFPAYTLASWQDWFIQTARLIMSRTPGDGVSIFFQTDIKQGGIWIDKSYLCQKAAETAGHSLIWHKIFCRTPPGSASFGRPSYSHLLCFSKEVRPSPEHSMIDVIPATGDKAWQRGMGIEVCRTTVKFIAGHTRGQTIINPFCGHGSMLAMANALGLAAIGIEKSPKRAKKAQLLQVTPDGKSWILP